MFKKSHAQSFFCRWTTTIRTGRHLVVEAGVTGINEETTYIGIYFVDKNVATQKLSLTLEEARNLELSIHSLITSLAGHSRIVHQSEDKQTQLLAEIEYSTNGEEKTRLIKHSFTVPTTSWCYILLTTWELIRLSLILPEVVTHLESITSITPKAEQHQTEQQSNSLEKAGASAAAASMDID